MSKTKQEMTAEFAAALECKPKFVTLRLVALGHFRVCGRCGGEGRHSYCQMYGDTCFGCGGAGKLGPKLTAALLKTVKGQVAAGALKPYLDRMARRAVCNTLIDRLFAAWTGSPTVARERAEGRTWQPGNPNSYSAKHYAINKAASTLCDEAQKLNSEVQHGRWSKEEKRYIKLTDAEFDTAAARGEAIVLEVAALETTIPETVQA